MLDKRRFDAAFNYLATATRLTAAEITPDNKRVYFDALSDLDTESVEGAAAQMAKQAQWFPKVAEWREAARSYTRSTHAKVLAFPLPPERGAWKNECDFCEDTGWCYEGGKTLHEVVMSGYEGRPRMHACVCRATNHTYARHNRSFGAAN
jgi:hypothetical protein